MDREREIDGDIEIARDRDRYAQIEIWREGGIVGEIERQIVIGGEGDSRRDSEGWREMDIKQEIAIDKGGVIDQKEI